MFENLKKYLSSSSLVDYQTSIIQKSSINLLDIDSYITELNKYNFILNNDLWGFNQIPHSNIFIRQNIILSTLYYLKKDFDKAREYKVKADDCFLKLTKSWMYIEGISYMFFVKESYSFYSRYVPNYLNGFIDSLVFQAMENQYKKLASPDNKICTTDTRFEVNILNEEKLFFMNDLYSCHYLNDGHTYIFVNHNSYINDHSKNLHVNYEFGHFTVFHDGKWIVLHPFYPGFSTKKKSPIKESWNHNIILDGWRTDSKIWRYLPNKPILEWSYKDGVYNFKIGKNITRRIEILNNGIFVRDSGGDYSSFNLSDDCTTYNFFGSKIVQKTGYHSPSDKVVLPHRRFEVYGENRIFSLGF